MPMVTVHIPYRGVYEGLAYIPEDQLDNLVDFLSDNDDILDEFLTNAHVINDQVLVLDAQLGD